MDTHLTIKTWVAAVEANDSAALYSLLAPNCELVSPLTNEFQFLGRRQVVGVFDAGLSIVKDVSVYKVLGDGRDWAVFLSGTINGYPVDEVQLHELDQDGKIKHITLMFRPLNSLQDLLTKIGPALEKRGVMEKKSAFAAAAYAPLALAGRAVEKLIMPRIGPSFDGPEAEEKPEAEAAN